MTPLAVTFLIVAVLIIWGGLVASTVMLSRHPEVGAYPAGGDDVEAVDRADPRE